MQKITINNIEFKMDLKQLGKIINSGAFTSETEIIVETCNVIWKWNKSTHGSIDEMFNSIRFKKQ